MKTRNTRYLIGEGFKGAWANRLMTLASIGVLVACMVIIGLALLISENVSRALGKLEQQNVVMVYMKDYSWALYNEDVKKVEEGGDENGIKPDMYVIHDDNEAKELCAKIEELKNVEAVEYISGEQGLESLKANMPEGQETYFTSLLTEKNGNPLPSSAKVTMKSMSEFGETVEKIKSFEGVDGVKAESDLAERINSFKKGLMVAGIWIISILMIISLVVVSNTIRITMYSRKLEISIMKAVGATDAFVRIPFVEGILIGLISALLSEGLLYFCYRIASETLTQTLGTGDIVRYSEMMFYLFGVFAAIGIFAGALGSFIMIGKYLRREGSEFSAI